MATLSFKSINKIYPNHVQAVFDFNLDVKDKEFIVFVGPSGCGKSTTLRMIAGLEEITYGQLYINGLEVNNVEPKDRNIAMVFQSYALYPHMTVFNNMAFALKLRKIPCPLFEPNSDADLIRANNLTLMKEVKLINKMIKKNDSDVSLIEQRDALYSEILANEEEMKKIQEPQVGIYEERIKELTNECKGIEKDIVKTKQRIAKLNASLENPKNEAKADEIKETISILEVSIEEKKKQLEDNLSQVEFLKVNEVPLFKKRKLNKYEIDLEVYKSAKALDLLRYLFRKPAALSGGQRQRVALGRAIVRNPKVFLMDEPLSNLDAKLRVQMRSEISKIHKRVGATTIYVTHDQTEAMTMADRIVVMKDGYIQQIGKPSEIYENPNNMFVAGFIGSPAMNFLKGVFNGKEVVISSEEGSVAIKLNKEQIKLLSDHLDKEVVLGIRPEQLALGTAKDQSLTLKCDFRELLGYEIIVYTYVCGQRLLVKVSHKEQVEAGEDVSVTFDTDSLYLFDPETGLRIR